MTIAPTLSICIPTWNRCKYLEELLVSVIRQAEAAGIADTVEVAISDNASTDGTGEMVRQLQRSTSVKILYARNGRNIGPIKNFFSTVRMANGKFAAISGDDDVVLENSLSRVVAALRSSEAMAGIFFLPGKETGGIPENALVRDLAVSAIAREAFYLCGNPGYSAFRTDLAKAYLARHGDDDSWTCWPQTELLFAAMAMSGQAIPAKVFPFQAFASPNHASNVRHSSWYLTETLLFALHRTAIRLRPTTGQETYRAACGHIFGFRRVMRCCASLWPVLFFEPHETVRQTAVQCREHISAYGEWRVFIPLFVIRLLVACPKWFFWVAWTARQLVKNPLEFGIRLAAIKFTREKYLTLHRSSADVSRTQLYDPAVDSHV